jgi:hypothetical protein
VGTTWAVALPSLLLLAAHLLLLLLLELWQ